MKAFVRYSPLLLIALAWEISSRLGLVSTLTLPALSDVVAAWFDLAKSGDLVAQLFDFSSKFRHCSFPFDEVQRVYPHAA